MAAIDTRIVQTLDWNLLKVFTVIVEAGGIGRAAGRLGRQQPAVSLALKRLEQRLGCTLCRRGPGGFALTDEGRRLAEICGRMRELIRDLPDGIAGSAHEATGRIRLRFISNLVSPVLDEVLASFHRKYPRVEIIVDVATWSDVVNALLRGEIDIGIAPSRRRRAELRYVPLFREVHRPYCGRTHPLFEARAMGPKRLAAERFILTGADEPDQLSDFRLRHGMGRQVAGMSEHLEEAKRLAVLGVGLCFLPDGYAEPDVAAKRLWPLMSAAAAPSMDIFVMTNPNSPPQLSRHLFVEEVASVLRRNEAGSGGRARRRARPGQR